MENMPVFLDSEAFVSLKGRARVTGIKQLGLGFPWLQLEPRLAQAFRKYIHVFI